jgi:lantibiotic modifying enzyme
MSAWEPLITDPELARRARAVIERTARFFDAQHTCAHPSPARLQRFLTRITGFDGVPAVALFFAYLALEGDEDALTSATTWLERAVEVTSGLQEPGPWLSNGVSGCAWVVTHTLSRLAGEPDSHEELDEMLLAFLDEGDELDAELTLGLAGLGTYFLQSRTPGGLERVLERLRAQADELPAGYAWRKRLPALSLQDRQEFPDGLYNLGLAHGVPGVTAFLARACAQAPLARELLEGSVSWLLAQRAPCGDSLFPCLVDPHRGPVERQSRLAWCYGDLGIAVAVLQAARAADRPDWERQALDIAQHAARRPMSSSGVEDGMICHGAAGVAHLFNRLYQTSRQPELRDAALRWYQATLDHDDPHSGPTGYRCLVREPQDAPTDDAPIVQAESYGLAVGISGVSLALLAGLGRVAPDWDTLLGTALDVV